MVNYNLSLPCVEGYIQKVPRIMRVFIAFYAVYRIKLMQHHKLLTSKSCLKVWND